MKTSKYSLLAALLLLSSSLWADAPRTMTALREHFVEPTEESAPWIFWYWMNGAVTKEGITADLEAMKEIGLEGTYLMPIRDSSRVQFMPNSVLQGTDRWWEMVGWSMQEADRLGLKMGLHICDGFALAGGPWISPEVSMQKVVYSMQTVAGGQYKSLVLDQPASLEGYYEDIACLPCPSVRRPRPMRSVLRSLAARARMSPSCPTAAASWCPRPLCGCNMLLTSLLRRHR